jgi:quinate/shikimate dehydrogenase (NAD+)
MEPRRDEAVVVGLIAAGIGGSFSPALHAREASMLGIDYEYRLLDLKEIDRPASAMGELVRQALRDGFRGLNVTHPCKQLVTANSTSSHPRRRRWAP